jgi:hypothetical protein
MFRQKPKYSEKPRKINVLRGFLVTAHKSGAILPGAASSLTAALGKMPATTISQTATKFGCKRLAAMLTFVASPLSVSRS